MNPYYCDYSEYIDRYFPGRKVQKISVNTNHDCPNRDGTLGTGGCIYCNNRSFTPAYCFGTKGIREQLESGKRFFGRKYSDMLYLAYFQSFSSTYGDGLRKELEEALSVEGIAGVVIGARPDCLGEEVIEVLRDIAARVQVFVEIGVESLNDSTLKLINRGHDSVTAVNGIRRAAEAGLHVGVHLIAGLPGENDDMALDTLRRICELPVESIKLHQLQVLKGSTLAGQLECGEITVEPYTYWGYLDFCVKAVEIIPRTVAIDRFLSQAPPGMVVMPKWGIKNHEFTDQLLKQLSLQKSVHK